MVLDVGTSTTSITTEACVDPGDLYNPNRSENGDSLANIDQEFIDNNDYEESSVNINGDAAKYNVSDILNEMRLGEPIEDDLINDLFNNNDINHFNMNTDLVDSTNNLNVEVENPHGMDFHDILNPETPNVQLDNNDSVVQFKYDASEQFNCDPNIALSYPDEPDSTIFIANVENNDDDQENIGMDTFLNETEPVPDNQLFECSTQLPMTIDEMELDIDKYITTEQNFSDTSFYDCHDIFLINDTDNKLLENGQNVPCTSVTQPDNTPGQNRTTQTVEVTTKVTAQAENMKTAPEGFQCDKCSFRSKSMHGLSVHKRIHSEKRVKCNKCDFSSRKAHYVRRHQAYVHGETYQCELCNFITHSASQIKMHMRRKH